MTDVNKNAVAAIRVSTIKQDVDGDSPEAQKEQIERFAQSRGFTIKKFFIFLESASKEQQPVQEAIDYCKNPKNDIQAFIFKSIDRFTRGGFETYAQLKKQLSSRKVKVIDIYGVINPNKVNTLDHLGFKYGWSEYYPSEMTEYMEAERAKNELRDIMSRMIGAEIRYTQMGFWMRQPPYGYISEKVETRNGKRCILRPHPTEAPLVKKIFELRERGTLYDSQIVDEINKLGYKSRIHYIRSKDDHTQIIKKRGGDPLTLKALQRIVSNPIYAGVNTEKWTNGKPVQCAFKGLVSVEKFNRANQGKKIISMDDSGDIVVYDKPPESRYASPKGIRNTEFPYRKYVMCPTCGKPLIGSSSRGKSGKHYPAYHCDKRGHYFRVPKKELEDTVTEFIGNIKISQEQISTLMDVIEAEWNKRQQSIEKELDTLEAHIQGLEVEAQATARKIRLVESEETIKYIEEDIMRIKKQIKDLEVTKAKKAKQKLVDWSKIKARVLYLTEHLDELLVKQIDPIKKAQFFAALFNKLPSYQDLKNGTQNISSFTGVNTIFSLAKLPSIHMVTSKGFTWKQLQPAIKQLDQLLEEAGLGDE